MNQTTRQTALPDAIAEHRLAVENFMERVRRVPEEEWDTGTDGKWSAAQEALHIALTWQAYTFEVREGPAVTPDTFAARTPEFRAVILPRILAGNWFPTGPVAPPMVEPQEVRTRDEVLHELAQNADRFEAAFVDAATRDPLRHVRHPYCGALTLAEAVIVDIEHTIHHGRKLPPAMPRP